MHHNNKLLRLEIKKKFDIYGINLQIGTKTVSDLVRKQGDPLIQPPLTLTDLTEPKTNRYQQFLARTSL